MTQNEFALWESFTDFQHALWMLCNPGWPDMKHDWQWVSVRNGLA